MSYMENLSGKRREDKILGMHEEISRRDFLNATLLASGGLLMEVSESLGTSLSGRLDGLRGSRRLPAVRMAILTKLCKRVTEFAMGSFRRFPHLRSTTGEMYDCVIVGGGISGLAAALFFVRQAGKNRKCLVLDNHPIFGGEAKGNEFEVDGHRLMAHQGSAVYFAQYPNSFISGFYDSIGLKSPKLQYQSWGGSSPEIPLSRTPYDMLGSEPASYGFYFGSKFGQRPGMWVTDPWGKKLQGAPISANRSRRVAEMAARTADP